MKIHNYLTKKHFLQGNYKELPFNYLGYFGKAVTFLYVPYKYKILRSAKNIHPSSLKADF